MDITIAQDNNVIAVCVDGVKITNVVDYKVTTSADGSTEVELKLKCTSRYKSIMLGTTVESVGDKQ